MAARKQKEVREIDCVAMTILLAAGSVSDLYHYRIPNYLIVSGWLTGLAFRLYRAGAVGLANGIYCIVVSIILLFPLYYIRAVGAGDIKLLSVVSGVYGLEFWVRTGVVFAVLAAMISLLHMLRRKSLINRFQYCIHYIFTKRTDVYYDPERDGREMVIPLAPVLAAAYYIVYLWR